MTYYHGLHALCHNIREGILTYDQPVHVYTGANSHYSLQAALCGWTPTYNTLLL